MNEEPLNDSRQDFFYKMICKEFKPLNAYRLKALQGKRNDSPQPYALRVIITPIDFNINKAHVFDFYWKEIDRVVKLDKWDQRLYFKTMKYEVLGALASFEPFTYKM